MDAMDKEIVTKPKSKKINYYLNEHLLIPYIHDKLSKPAVRNKIIEGVGNFIDTHMKVLSAPAPMYQMPFGEKEEAFLYEVFDLTPDKLREIFNEMDKETWDGKISKMFVSFMNHTPAKLMVIAMLIDALRNNYEDMVECAEYIYAFIEYPILFHKSWPLGVKEDVMLATLENINGRFTITKTNNVQEWLKHDMDGLLETYQKSLIVGSDDVYTAFMQNCRNWLKSKFKNIANVYYKIDEQNITQHTQVSSFDDGTLNDQTGINSIIMQISTATSNKFTNKEISDSLVRAVSENSGIDKDLVKDYISKIYNTGNNRIPIFVENVINAYFNKYPTEMRLDKTNFISFGLALFRSIANSKNQIYISIKQVLDYWMNDIVDIDAYTSRAATKINYTKAIYNYMIFMIANYNN